MSGKNKKPIIYISSPYTLGNKKQNVMRQIVAGTQLINDGFVPFLPLLNHYIHVHFPQSYDVWLEQDIAMLDKCDGILRLSGESKGADIEVAYAKEHMIPVFYTCEDVKQYYEYVEETSAVY